jgi:hypothetical protein
MATIEGDTVLMDCGEYDKLLSHRANLAQEVVSARARTQQLQWALESSNVHVDALMATCESLMAYNRPEAHQRARDVIAAARSRTIVKPEPGPATRAMIDELRRQLGPFDDYATVSLDRPDAEKLLAEWPEQSHEPT